MALISVSTLPGNSSPRPLVRWPPGREAC